MTSTKILTLTPDPPSIRLPVVYLAYLNRERETFMFLFDILSIHHPDVSPQRTKIHFAVFNGSEHPIDVFCAGDFNSWQAWQGKGNFSRDFVVSLIRMPGSSDRWLFAGIYRPLSSKPHPKSGVLYEMEQIVDAGNLSGRVVVNFKNTNRQTVPYAENVSDRLSVSEVRAKPVSNRVFTGYYDVRLTKSELDGIVKKGDPEWLGPLSAAQGIYLITDTATGRLYVGSATASGRKDATGFWSRWSRYSADGHGGNVKLMAILEERGQEYARNFQYSILEVIPPQLDDEAVKVREGHWKRVLASVAYGYNDNLERDIDREM